MSEAENPPAVASRLRQVGWVSLMLVGVILSLWISLQTFGVLYGMLFPPLPPLPASVTETAHVSHYYGHDEWLYTTSWPVQDLQSFYESAADRCEISSTCHNSACSVLCVSDVAFSVFSSRWWVRLEAGEADENASLSIMRYVYWSGQLPPSRMEPPGSGFTLK